MRTRNKRRKSTDRREAFRRAQFHHRNKRGRTVQAWTGGRKMETLSYYFEQPLTAYKRKLARQEIGQDCIAGLAMAGVHVDRITVIDQDERLVVCIDSNKIIYDFIV